MAQKGKFLLHLLTMTCTKIISLSNPKIRETLDIKNRRSRHKHNAFIVEGPHLIEMAISSECKIKTVFFTHAFASKKENQRLIRQILKETDEAYEISEHILDKLTDTETPQGILAVTSYTPQNLDLIQLKTAPLLIVIDGVQEPGNLGTMIRTADAAGADAVVILKGTCDPFMQKTLRSTAGSIFNIPIVYAKTEELFEWLTAKKISMIATAVDSRISLFNADLKTGITFVFGNEAHGISDEIKRKADLTIKIPIPGKAESLNVSASAAICLYEAVRQRISVSF